MPHLHLTHLITRILSSAAWTFVGVLIFYGGCWMYDYLDPIDYKAEIEKGNVAAGVKMAAVTLALAGIVVAAILS